MLPITNHNVIHIMLKTLNHVDPRLIDHGKRVAYIVFKMLRMQDKYDEKMQRDICFLALLHDIGAYKTEEIDQMVNFETKEIWDHSIYGHLFIKYFSPLKHLTPILLFHHVDYIYIKKLPADCLELSQIIHMADRIDVILQNGKNREDIIKYLEFFREVRFRSDLIDLFISAEFQFDEMENMIESDAGFRRIMYEVPFTEQEIKDYIKMTVLSIDFRSYHTVTHTIATACISSVLADLLHLGPADTYAVTNGAMLHDLGKTGIPIEILENTGRLSPDQMEVMRTHVSMTEDILRGNIDPVIFKIATRHHEKLDGTGYPNGLRAGDLTGCERIVAVADIVSALCGTRSYKNAFPKEKTIDIISQMGRGGQIDSKIVDTVIANFDFIMQRLSENGKPILDLYDKINKEHKNLKSKTSNLGTDDWFNYDELINAQ